MRRRVGEGEQGERTSLSRRAFRAVMRLARRASKHINDANRRRDTLDLEKEQEPLGIELRILNGNNSDESSLRSRRLVIGMFPCSGTRTEPNQTRKRVNLLSNMFQHNLDRYTTWPMFARDIGPDSASALSTQNLYGVHPFYMCLESDGKAHGVFILNSNAQEVETGPGPHLVYRTIGGRLDMAFFPGPTPEEVVNQYLQHIGFPFLPAYWALGYQLCRWGYGSLDDMKKVISRNQALGIPLDVPYADIDYMNHYEDFTEGDVRKFEGTQKINKPFFRIGPASRPTPNSSMTRDSI